MKSKVSIYIMVALFLLGFTMMLLPIVSAQSEPWYITENTTLTSDYIGRIIIETDDITLDGAGYCIIGASGDNIKEGIWLLGVSGVTVKNCYITNFFTGIVLQDSHGNTISNNVAYDNFGDGISMFAGSSGNVIEDNIAENSRGTEGAGNGFTIEESSNNIFMRNIAKGNVRNGFNFWLDSDNNVIIGNIAKDNLGGFGFYSERSDGSTFIRNKAFSHQVGFSLGLAEGISMQNNIAIGNGIGFQLDIQWCSIEGNKAMHNVDYGFFLWSGASDNLISRNVGFGNGEYDALQQIFCLRNIWEKNHFGSTYDIG